MYCCPPTFCKSLLLKGHCTSVPLLQLSTNDLIPWAAQKKAFLGEPLVLSGMYRRGFTFYSSLFEKSTLALCLWAVLSFPAFVQSDHNCEVQS